MDTATHDFFRSRIDAMIDLRHPLAALAAVLPWADLERRLGAQLEEQGRAERRAQGSMRTPVAPSPCSSAQADWIGAQDAALDGGLPWALGVQLRSPSAAGRPRLNLRLMLALTLLKNSYNLSDEALVERFAENVYWQHFAGYIYFEPSLPCDATQIGRFRTALGEAGLEELLSATLHTAVGIGAIERRDFKRLIIDTTVQEKAIAYPTDSRLLDIARRKVVRAAKACGLVLKQTFNAEGKTLARKGGGYAHAKQLKRLARTVKRQRTVLGIVMRDVQRQLAKASAAEADLVPPAGTSAQMTAKRAAKRAALHTLLERAERVRVQQRHDKDKLYALHAPEVECIGKGKARQPYEFGVKASVAVTHRGGLIVGARSFAGNPYDGHTLAEQIEQSAILMQDLGVQPECVVVDLGYRSPAVKEANPGVDIIHRGRYKSLTKTQRRWLKRRQAVEPVIGHLKSDCRLNRCWLKGAVGDSLHILCCALGYNIRWLLRACTRLGRVGFFTRSAHRVWQRSNLRAAALGRYVQLLAAPSPIRA